MTYTEIKDLLSSGFTPEQITQLTTSGVNPSAPESPSGGEPITPTGEVTSPAEVGEETPLPSPTEGENNNPDPDPDPLEDIRSQIQQLQQENKQLREQIQTNNIRDRTTETPGIPEVSAEDILSGLIRPVYDEKGGRK